MLGISRAARRAAAGARERHQQALREAKPGLKALRIREQRVVERALGDAERRDGAALLITAPRRFSSFSRLWSSRITSASSSSSSFTRAASLQDG